jgi:hypothetical protein
MVSSDFGSGAVVEVIVVERWRELLLAPTWFPSSEEEKGSQEASLDEVVEYSEVKDT